MEVIFFQPEPRVNARHEESEISADQTLRTEAPGSFRHLICPILLHSLHPAQLAFGTSRISSFVLAGFMRQRMNAAKPVRTQSIIHNITYWNKSSVNC
jgi:hypothetical protein